MDFPYNLRQRIVRKPVLNLTVGAVSINYRDISLYENKVDAYLESVDAGKRLLIYIIITI